MPVVLGRDGHTHLTTFADASTAICGEPTAEVSARIGDMAVTHDGCLALETRRTLATVNSPEYRRHHKRHCP